MNYIYKYMLQIYMHIKFIQFERIELANKNSDLWLLSRNQKTGM